MTDVTPEVELVNINALVMDVIKSSAGELNIYLIFTEYRDALLALAPFEVHTDMVRAFRDDGKWTGACTSIAHIALQAGVPPTAINMVAVTHLSR